MSAPRQSLIDPHRRGLAVWRPMRLESPANSPSRPGAASRDRLLCRSPLYAPAFPLVGVLRQALQQNRNDCCNLTLIVDVCLPELLAHVAFFELELAPQRSERNHKCNQPAHFRDGQGTASECD